MVKFELKIKVGVKNKILKCLVHVYLYDSILSLMKKNFTCFNVIYKTTLWT